jgi:hypothetical protein
MAQEIRADPDALIALAGACLAAADSLGSHYRTGLCDLALPGAAFGDLPAAPAAALTAERLLADAQDAVSGLVAVLEGDADRLLGTAFAYREADRQADIRVGGARRPTP